jgi:hypothetical protein
VRPRVPPHPTDDRELRPFLLECLQCHHRLVGVERCVDQLEVLGHRVELAARNVFQSRAEEGNDAGLNRCGREHRLDRLGEPFEPVNTGDEDVGDAALFELGEDLHPELGALGVLKPHAQHFAVPVEVDPQSEVTRLALNGAAVTDLQHQRVQEDDGVDVIQRAGLPRPCVLHDSVGDPGDQVTADLNPVDLLQMRADVPG